MSVIDGECILMFSEPPASTGYPGTSAISLEETHQRQSFDLGFHNGEALIDVRPLLTEMLMSWLKGNREP
ncbi:MAG: hypothetical protein JSV89_20930 [Spirochaetaceae bacterium]|nr:MAG: hypothetical protein JSV89_20930 [Spirochaetaceae bacterium]